jgi:hypothetical protein
MSQLMRTRQSTQDDEPPSPTPYLLPTGKPPPFDELSKVSIHAILIRYVRMIQNLHDLPVIPEIDLEKHNRVDCDSLYEIIKCIHKILNTEDPTAKNARTAN